MNNPLRLILLLALLAAFGAVPPVAGANHQASRRSTGVPRAP